MEYNTTEWRDRANCGSTDPEVFFPEKRRDRAGDIRTQSEMAKRICAACDVRPECLDAAIIGGEVNGIWGGLTPEERQAMRHRRFRNRSRG